MYSHCLFCSASLGTNETLAAFPVGRRFAFDASRGRLWVVCPSCERWCLSPLEERWEAIEEAERAFAGSPRRASTAHIGLARTADGTSLIRVGAPSRAEFAAWRYGDQFGRRRRRQIALTVGGVAVGAGIIIGGPVLGLWAAGAINAINIATNLGNIAHQRRTIAHVPVAASDQPLAVSRAALRKLRLTRSGEEWALAMPYRAGPAWSPMTGIGGISGEVQLTGREARRAAGILLPHVNRFAGSARAIDGAVRVLESVHDSAAVFANASRNLPARGFVMGQGRLPEGALAAFPVELRLAMEMAAHEESEARALEGELAELERAWRDAEEIAAIADNLLLPSPVQGAFARLGRKSTRGEPTV